MTGIEHRPLGPSGLVVSTVGLGCNNFGRPGTVTETQEGTDAVVHAALDAGVTLLDTADIYGGTPGQSETMLGAAIAGRRDEVVLATKFGMDMGGANGPDWGVRGSRRYVRLAVESSLRRLGTDWIDLYQMHRPDSVTPIEETLSVLDDLVREGKIRYVGHSNFAGWQIAEAELTASIAGTTAFVSAQNEYSPLSRDVEAEVLPAVRAYALGFLPFFPLYNGLLSGKYTRGDRPQDGRLTRLKPELLDSAPWDVLEEYQRFCDERGVTMLQATFAWLLAQPGLTSVIAGATRPEQITQNVDAGTAWVPSEDDLAEMTVVFDAA
ncbi:MULTISPECIES: aldo/keto reductase [unclassified Curtobacterium]|jgi:aryl-alcohol dehydrogenase-like predicted oxidoreductase|uniref:aldo/keto reductase n=1 Tax=unclassified Curtobacterium TaxID=257496 RepID=UPI00188BE0DD|nr:MULTISPECIES: aldo/keto reductase [unclassified Curtobacterium]MBF4591544.1 aldo/keto reductase [Curtobacterium sp. VKM Ac-1395]MCY1694925.1 aldo/keto reductase [Curtobacterium sp. SL109]